MVQEVADATIQLASHKKLVGRGVDRFAIAISQPKPAHGRIDERNEFALGVSLCQYSVVRGQTADSVLEGLTVLRVPS